MSKRSVLLLAVLTTASAFVIPALARAASWGVIGTTHVLDSAGFNATFHTGIGTMGWTCTNVQYHMDIFDAAQVRITGIAFSNCHGSGLAAGCTVTATPTNLPWTDTGIIATNVKIDGVHVDLVFETQPPAGSVPCPFINQKATMTGNPQGGVWNAAAHQVAYTNATGMTTHISPFGPAPVTMTTTMSDTSQTWTLT